MIAITTLARMSESMASGDPLHGSCKYYHQNRPGGVLPKANQPVSKPARLVGQAYCKQLHTFVVPISDNSCIDGPLQLHEKIHTLK